MMNEVIEVPISCPYCGEANSVLIEPLEEAQEYMEDCRVCCRPIIITVVTEADGNPTVTVRTENDTF